MFQTVNHCCRSPFLWAILFSFVLMGETPRPVWAADKKPVLLDVLLPTDAELNVDGYKSTSTGETRQFQSPPMTTGRTYAYELKVVWHGQSLTRRVELQPDKLLTLDLRSDVQSLATPKPPGSFALLVPPALTLTVDRNAMIPLRVKRFDFPESIRVVFEGLPKGIRIPETTFSEGRNEGHALVFVANDATPGTHEILVVAASGATKDSSCLELTIIKPELKVEKKPETKAEIVVAPKPETKAEIVVAPKPETKPAKVEEAAPVLQMLLPAAMEVQAGRTRLVEVQVKTTNGLPLSTEPSLTLKTATSIRLHATPWTSSYKPDQSACTIGLAVTVETECPAGKHEVRICAVAGSDKAERTLIVTVKPSSVPSSLGLR